MLQQLVTCCYLVGVGARGMTQPQFYIMLLPQMTLLVSNQAVRTLYCSLQMQ